MVHYYGSKSNTYVFDVGSGKSTKIVKIFGGEFLTDDDKLAKDIEDSEAFKAGKVFPIEGIAKSKKSSVHSGARATTGE